MSTYIIYDANGYEISTGVPPERAMELAQECANERDEPVVIEVTHNDTQRFSSIATDCGSIGTVTTYTVYPEKT